MLLSTVNYFDIGYIIFICYYLDVFSFTVPNVRIRLFFRSPLGGRMPSLIHDISMEEIKNITIIVKP